MTVFAMLVAGWLTPMFQDRGAGMSRTVLTTTLLVGALAFLYVVRRIADVGPLVKGEARWRYRSRALRERVGRARTWLVLFDRTPGWWLTRVEFTVAFSLAALPPALFLTQPTFVGVPYGSEVTSAYWLAYAGVLVGLAWMIRIYRAPLRMDSKAYWRYRDGA